MNNTLWLLTIAWAATSFCAPAAVIDVVVVVDESGSMSTEHAWLPGMISSLDARLNALNLTGRYGLIGFGGNRGIDGRTLLTGGTAASFAAAAGNLITSGGTEDGYTALNYAYTTYGFAAGAARNYILVTDEDRDVRNSSLTFATTQAALVSQNALLNAVVNNPFSCSSGTALGRTTSEGFQVSPGGTYNACASPVTGNGTGATETNYVPLALGSGGAAWNLNVLRAGGNSAASFTNAFVDIKVREIEAQTPEPSTYSLAGTALTALSSVVIRSRRKRRGH